MTAQRGDTFIHKGNSYIAAAMTSPTGFNPADYGLIPKAVCTACWRGYWCDYEIRDNGLYLKNLYIHTQDDHYPDINGVSVAIRDTDPFNVSSEHFGHCKYEDVGLFIPYTGKIIAGAGFIDRYYRHMGFQSPYAYRSLMEFIFEDGALKKAIDHSKRAEEIRKWIDASEPGEGRSMEDIAEYVRRSFSMDYKDKAWWL